MLAIVTDFWIVLFGKVGAMLVAGVADDEKAGVADVSVFAETDDGEEGISHSRRHHDPPYIVERTGMMSMIHHHLGFRA